MRRPDSGGKLFSRKITPDYSIDDAEYFEMDQFDSRGLTKQLKLEERSPLYQTQSPLLNRILNFLRGPEIAVDDLPDFTKSRLLPFERFPSLFNIQYSHLKRSLLLIIYLLCWFTVINWILSPVLKNGPVISEDGIEYDVLTMSCTGSGEFWRGKNQHCGLGAELCLPDRKEVIIKCPALCDRGWTYSSTPVGDTMVKYRQYTVGGGSIPKKEQKDYDLTYPYRGDSFPCSSAVHAGILSPLLGGCLKLKFDGAKLSFDSHYGAYNTGFSVNFNSFFPSSFIFERFTHGTTFQGCYDPRFGVLLTNFLFGVPLIYLASGFISYWVLSLVGFWTVILALDPPSIPDGKDPNSIATLFSIGFERLLPLCFVLYVMWKSTVYRTLSEPSSPISKVLLWYPLFWVGIANNVTFDRLPVDRLTPRDIKEMPGSFLTIILIVIGLIICSVVQGHQLWKSGRLIIYIKYYFLVLIGSMLIVSLPGLGFRIHHYILGMALLPATSTRSISAFILQGVLLGLMISGIARWDFASIAESNVSLMRGEAGTSTIPPVNFSYSNGNVSWTPSGLGDLDGYSLLINDVERYVGTETSISIDRLIQSDKQLKEIVNLGLTVNEEVLLYLRLAKSSTEKDSFTRGDYTRAGLLVWPIGNWTDPLPGVT